MTNYVSIHQRIAGCPAELLVITGMAETVTAGHLFGLHVTPDNEIIIAAENDKPVAFIVFEEYEDGEFWIKFGYCLPKYRRKGYYRSCIEKLRETAMTRGFTRIHTAVHPDNAAARASIEERGGKLLYLGYTFPVEVS